MLAQFLAISAPQPASSDEALALCKPALARKAGSEIATIEVDQSQNVRGGLTIEGRLTAYARMGLAPAGSARAHHVGRIDFSYSCEVIRDRVRKVRVNPFEPSWFRRRRALL